jgi:hypothetical protein
MVASVAQKQKEGRPLFKDLRALEAACERLGMPKPKRAMGYFPKKDGRRELLLLSFPRRESDGDSHWHDDAVKVDMETGEDYFDNYSDFTENHQDVKSGKRRLGEAGRWGRIERLWELDQVYQEESIKITAQEMLDVGKSLGQPVMKDETLDNGLKRHLQIGNPVSQQSNALLS